jgi:ribulose-phosphate 3-epimerase
MVDIVPALLSHSRSDLFDKLSRIRGVAHAIHIDIMDGSFVHNRTIGAADATNLPFDGAIEYHLMVSDPARWIHEIPGGPNVTYQVHAEAAHGQFSQIAAIVAHRHSKLSIALNPSTSLDSVVNELQSISHVLIMAVVPGIDGQKYMDSVEGKIAMLRSMRPEIIIEVDGGINVITARRAVLAGANRLAAATSIFGFPDAGAAYRNLQLAANSQNP